MSNGSLRVYLGAAPGVGKTCAMLAEGVRRASRGADVVVGYVETHGRARTAAMIGNLEVVPRRVIDHHGVVVQEMDLAAVLARKPAVVLVDELAHTDAPGSAHEKRWQDVHELLAAGVDVISTVNVQHLESLNDAVFAITGVRQRETVPDAVVRAAEQIELVDMSPEALRRRMAHGNVYASDQVDAALANYFRPGNLTALRELALLWLADRVDESLDRYRSDHDIRRSWPTRTRLVVALSGGPEGDTLLRRAARIAASGSGGELHAVHVLREDGLAGPDLPTMARLRRLTEELDGTFHTVTGSVRPAAVLDFARGINASQIVVGMSRRARWRGIFRRDTAEALIAASGDIDVHVVTHELARTAGWRRPPSGLARNRLLAGWLSALLAPLLLTGALHALPDAAAPNLPLIVQVYLLLTVTVALIGGMLPAVTAGVCSSLLINWFFTPPFGTLTIASTQNALALALFIAVGATVSLVVHRSARRAATVVQVGAESAALAELSHTLLASTDQLTLLLSRAGDLFGVKGAAVVTTPRDGAREVVAASEGYPGHPWTTLESIDDDHDLVLLGAPVPAERQRLLSAYAAHAGAVLHRRGLEEVARSTAGLERDNRARTALLSAVSHDLRTPLAGVKAAVGSLRSNVQFSPQDEAELLEVIENSADRLEGLIDNLLDMSRLQVGALVAHPRVVDLAEVILPAIAATGASTRMRWAIGENARYAVADAGLLDRVLGNLIENALRYQATDSPLTVTTSRIAAQVEIRVVDTGRGVPPALHATIFRPFQRHDDVPTDSGVGLGLAVARGLTEAMGGTLELEETPGGGLTSVVALPVETDAHDPREPR
ncbi:ATP-binding protein [Calidifontibacter terrae]